MKLQNTVGEVTVANVGAVSNFKINASAKSFSILSNSLYQNKIRAIIRELSCNALDSHIEAGTDRPFEVHLPSFIDPYFSVTDYGLGMTPEQITSTYTTYFESTKTTTNNLIGALGLGAKSPFSYTDAMVITSNCNGICTVYSAFIDSVGIPCITQLNQSDTEAGNGLSIQFAVKEQDFNLFSVECVAVFQWWKSDDRPIIHNLTTPIKDVRVNSVPIMPGVMVMPTYTDNVPYRSSIAIMGNIAYPIEQSHFDKIYCDILVSGLIIEFPIGELDFQPSREGLSYINYTKDNITKKLKEILDYTHQHVKNEIDSCDNVWDRNAKIMHFNSKKMYLAATLNYINTHNKHDVKTSMYGCTVKGITFSYTMTEFNIQLTRLNRSPYYHRSETSIIPNSDYKYNFVINENSVRGVRTRALAKWKEDRESKIILEPIDSTKPMDLVGFKTYLKNPPESLFIHFNDLPKLPPKPRSSVKKDTKTINVQRYSFGGTTSAIAIDLENTNTHYYIKCTGTLWDGKYSAHIRDTRLVRIAVNTFPLGGDVYKVNKNQYALIKIKPNWIDLEEYIENRVQQFESQLNRLCSYIVSDSTPCVSYELCKQRVNKFEEFDTKWGSLFNAHSAEYSERVLTLINIFGSDELKTKRTDAITAVRALTEAFYVKYPMLRYVSSSCGNSIFKEDDCVNYINLVDSQ